MNVANPSMSFPSNMRLGLTLYVGEERPRATVSRTYLKIARRIARSSSMIKMGWVIPALASKCRPDAGGTVARDKPDSDIEGEI